MAFRNLSLHRQSVITENRCASRWRGRICAEVNWVQRLLITGFPPAHGASARYFGALESRVRAMVALRRKACVAGCYHSPCSGSLVERVTARGPALDPYHSLASIGLCQTPLAKPRLPTLLANPLPNPACRFRRARPPGLCVNVTRLTGSRSALRASAMGRVTGIGGDDRRAVAESTAKSLKAGLHLGAHRG